MPAAGKPLPDGLTSAETVIDGAIDANFNTVVSPAIASVEKIVDPLCPKCHWRLIDPATMGYCPKCGYCRYIEAERRSSALIDLSERRPSFLGARGVIAAVASLPGWLSMLLGGSFAILLYAKAVDHMLPEGVSDREVLGITMLVAGALVLGLSHLWALLKVAPSYVDVGPLDIFSPGLVWGTALRRLPETRWQLWLAGWSITVIAAACFFIL